MDDRTLLFVFLIIWALVSLAGVVLSTVMLVHLYRKDR